MLIKREVINKIDIFDERFTPGNFEDDDLCIRIIEAKYKLMVCRDSFIHNLGSESFDKDYSKINDVLRANAQKFEEKWNFNSNYESIIKFDVIGCIKEPVDKKLNILEFNCDLGATLLRLKYMYLSARLYGIEINTNISRISGKMIEIITEDFKENTIDFFDYIILGNKLQFSTDPWKLLKEIKKFLKPEGDVIATIPNAMHYSVDSLCII